jgi:hypothetical protein
MSTPFFTKDLENTVIHLVPTGNNVRRGKEAGGAFNQVVEATIIKVTKVNVMLKVNNSNYETKHRIHDCHLNNISAGLNSGHECYLSNQDVEDEKLRLDVERKLRQMNFELTAEQAKEISKIMKW